MFRLTIAPYAAFVPSMMRHGLAEGGRELMGE